MRKLRIYFCKTERRWATRWSISTIEPEPDENGRKSIVLNYTFDFVNKLNGK